ncbi:hypothetical protein AgCh_008886 [Apium graveolens]
MEAANQAKIDVSEAKMKGAIGAKEREGLTLQNAAKIDAESKIMSTRRQGEGNKGEIRVKTEMQIYKNQRDATMEQANVELATKKAVWSQSAKMAQVEADGANHNSLDGSKIRYLKHQIDDLNEENYVYNYTLIEGEGMVDKIDKISYETIQMVKIINIVLVHHCGVVTSGRQLAKSLELKSLNGLGFSKRYVRCLQISEVVNSMKDLMDFCKEQKDGPIDFQASRRDKEAPESKGLFKQSRDGDVVECVLSHLQPAFDHPLLKGQKPLHAVALATGDQYYGAKASINVWAPRVIDQYKFSLSQVWVISGSF